MTTKKLSDLFEETAAQNAQEWDRYNTSERIAAREERRKREHQVGVNLGWWDEDGNSLLTDDAPNEDEDEDEDKDKQ
jgi:hypothetical protein